MDAETASMASTAVCASEQAEAAQKVCAERAVWSCIVVRAIVHASFLLRCSDFSAADGIFQVINFIKLSPGPAKKLGDSAGNRPGSRRGCRAGRRYCSADGFEGGLEVGEDVVDVLGADGQADGIGADALVGELLLGQLAVGRGGRVDDQALDVRDVGEQGEDLQIVDELMGLGLAALDLKGEDGAAAVREVLLVERMVRVVRQRRMVDALDLRMVREEVHDFAGILRVPLKAERERLDALQKKERSKRRDRRAGIAQEDRADIGHEGRGGRPL